jgi:hypothetical protein
MFIPTCRGNISNPAGERRHEHKCKNTCYREVPIESSVLDGIIERSLYDLLHEVCADPEMLSCGLTCELALLQQLVQYGLNPETITLREGVIFVTESESLIKSYNCLLQALETGYGTVFFMQMIYDNEEEPLDIFCGRAQSLTSKNVSRDRAIET